jgi:hypothetical protein
LSFPNCKYGQKDITPMTAQVSVAIVM